MPAKSAAAAALKGSSGKDNATLLMPAASLKCARTKTSNVAVTDTVIPLLGKKHYVNRQALQNVEGSKLASGQVEKYALRMHDPTPMVDHGAAVKLKEGLVVKPIKRKAIKQVVEIKAAPAAHIRTTNEKTNCTDKSQLANQRCFEPLNKNQNQLDEIIADDARLDIVETEKDIFAGQNSMCCSDWEKSQSADPAIKRVRMLLEMYKDEPPSKRALNSETAEVKDLCRHWNLLQVIRGVVR